MASTSPWKDDRWLPGVLNYSQIEELKRCGLIQNAIGKIGRNDSAIDLHLSSEAYIMTKGSIKPFEKNYSDIIKDRYYADPYPSSNNTFCLRTEQCYVFKIQEKLHPAIVNSSPFYGQATAKSSIGRVDVIARLIVDGMKEYEKFNPKKVTTGEMFLEITPITFNVIVKEGISLSQLRFCNGDFEDSTIRDEKFIDAILNLSYHHPQNSATLSVDVSNFKLTNELSAAAYCASNGKSKKALELWADDGTYAASDFWVPVQSNEEQNIKSITINKNNFYILRSLERISLPPGVCIYCRAMDETLGEMRIHYAGFVHPLFGLNREDKKTGTPLIFEVRGHNVDVLLTQGEILARLFFYRMSCLAEEPISEKSELNDKKENAYQPVAYGDQELKLSKFFKQWEQ